MTRTLRHARQRLTLAHAYLEAAPTERARSRAARRERAARRGMIEALRLADLEG